MKKTIVAATIFVAGCSSDPATEAPVALEAGLYEVTVGGGTLVEFKSGKRTEQICFWSADAVTFPTNPLVHTIGEWDNCTSQLDEPRGNAISGARLCDRKAPMTVAYSGSHTTNSFDIRGTVTQGSGEGGGVMRLGSGDFAIVGKRVGNC